MPKQYLLEFRNQVVLAIQNGLPIVDASQQYHISSSTLYRWMKKQEQPSTDSAISNYTTLQRKSQHLDHILQIIRLSEIIDQVPLQKRLEILARLHEQFVQYSVYELCEALNVSGERFTTTSSARRTAPST